MSVLPESGGRPQVRERVFILAEYVREGAPIWDLRAQPVSRSLDLGGWSPANWRVDDWLMADDQITHPSEYRLRDEEVVWLSAWNELIQQLDSPRLPGFPLWADAFRAGPVIPEGTAGWKEGFLRKNSHFYLENRLVVDRWLTKHDGLQAFPPSRRKFEWQAQNAPRDVWRLVVHLRPSGIRVKQGTYLPALVAITQTSIIGWRRRRITPREAARLQGFPDGFALHPIDARAYQQLGNAVNVGVVQKVATLLAGGLTPAAQQIELDELANSEELRVTA